MKTCPRCQKAYSDDNLNFCLEDGSVLSQSSSEPMAETLFVSPPRTTQPQPQMPSQPSAQGAWNAPQQYSPQQPKKSSKTWIWVLLILGGLALICGGGFIGFLFYVGSQVENVADLSNSSKSSPSPTINNKGTSNSSTSTTSSTSGRSDVETVNLSIFVKEFSVYGTTELNNGELTMGSKQKGYYYVLVAPDNYLTEDADTRVTLRNIDNASSSLGYGLIFHSNPEPLQQDYAFLIDTKRKKYRIVHHSPQKETAVVNWTSSTAIKDGSEENTLEARDLDGKIDLYINGTKVNSITNVYGFPSGVPGLYSGDGVKIAFKNLEIRR